MEKPDLDYYQQEFLKGTLKAFFHEYSNVVCQLPPVIGASLGSFELEDIESGSVIKLTGNLIFNGFAKVSVNLPNERYAHIKPFSLSQVFFGCSPN